MTNTDVRNHTSDRILVLRPIPGKEALTSKGLTDPRLFKGGNALHAFLDTTTLLWKCKFEQGILPDELKVSFTKFSLLLEYVKKYFLKRNIEVTEVVDATT